MRLFEVRKNGVLMWSANDESCINPEYQLVQMVENGYKVYIRGKEWKPPKKRGDLLKRKDDTCG